MMETAFPELETAILELETAIPDLYNECHAP